MYNSSSKSCWSHVKTYLSSQNLSHFWVFHFIVANICSTLKPSIHLFAQRTYKKLQIIQVFFYSTLACYLMLLVNEWTRLLFACHIFANTCIKHFLRFFFCCSFQCTFCCLVNETFWSKKLQFFHVRQNAKTLKIKIYVSMEWTQQNKLKALNEGTSGKLF